MENLLLYFLWAVIGYISSVLIEYIIYKEKFKYAIKIHAQTFIGIAFSLSTLGAFSGMLFCKNVLGIKF